MLLRLNPEKIMKQSPPGMVSTSGVAFSRALQGGIDLLAYDVGTKTSFQVGEQLAVHLYWRAWQPDLPDYQVILSLARVGEHDQPSVELARHRHPGDIPSSTWTSWPLLNFYVRDSYYLQIHDGVEPGRYQIVVEVGRCRRVDLFPCETVEPLFVRDAQGSSLGRQIVLPTAIEISP